MAITQLFYDDFIGASGSVPNAAWWTRGWSSGGATLFGDGRLRTFFTNAGNAHGYVLTVDSIAPEDNPTFHWSLSSVTGSAGYSYFAGLVSGPPLTTTGGSYTFSHGAWFRGGATNSLTVKGTVGTLTLSGVPHGALTWEGTNLHITDLEGNVTATYDVSAAGEPAGPLRGFLAIHAPASGSGLSGSAYWNYAGLSSFSSAPAVVDVDFTDTAPAAISIETIDPTFLAEVNPDSNQAVGPTTIAIGVPEPTVLAQRNIVEPAGVASIGVSVPEPFVIARGNVNVQAPSFAINATAPGAIRNVGSTAALITDDASAHPSDPDTNYNSGGILVLPSNTAGTALYKWKFNTAKENVYKAFLRFRLLSTQNANQSWNIWAITEPWDETTLTWNTRPAMTHVGTLNQEMGISGVYTVDVSKALVGAHGFAFSSTNSNQSTLYSSENQNAGGEPGVLTTYYEVNPSNINIDATAVTLTVASGQHTGSSQADAQVNAEPATITLDASGADVFATDTVLIQAGVAEVQIDTFDARGGDPNASVSAEIADITVLAPNGAEGIGGEDKIVSAEAVEITTTILEPSVSNITDVEIKAEAIGVRIKLVGFYNRDEDKWADYIQSSLAFNSTDPRENYEDYGDRWFRFEEQPGSTTAKDETGKTGAVYHGNPSLRVEATDTRSAVGLDGIDDFVDLNPLLLRQGIVFIDNSPLPLGMSVETVMRTTATSGTVFSNGLFGLEVTENGLRWTDANNRGGGWSEKFLDIENSKVNDGQWHHIVWLMNEGGGRNTLMVDGQVVWSRQAWNNWTPAIPTRIGMRENAIAAGNNMVNIDLPLRPLQGDFMEFIVRQRINYSRDAAQRSYYILNNHTLIDAKVADTVRVSTPQAAKARGNQKKMLVLYGNSETTNDGNQFNMFHSSWSGMNVPRGPLQDGWGESPHLMYNLYDNEQRHLYPPRPVDFKGYKVYYAHMFEPGRYSSPGVVKNTGEDFFYDNQTGEPRYIDVNRDLAVDVDEFDVIHVMHWPAANLDPYLGSDYLPYFSKQDEFDYDRARNLFKESIRKANSKGVGLWISEAAMAVEFGIAKSYNVHFREEESYGSRYSVRDTNTHEYHRDLELGRKILNVAGGNKDGFYHHTYFVRNRRIVGTATGFSEKPTWYVGERIYWQGDDQLRAHARAYAHKLENLPNGLTIGSEFTLMVGANWQGAQAYRDERVHYGLDPNGIVGNVIAKEETTFWTRGVEKPNAHAEVVTTVLVERGTILEGTPVGGRIFVELMDNDWDEDPIYQPAPYNQYMNGTLVEEGYSLWDYDDRRQKELFRHDLERGRYIKYYNNTGEDGRNVSQDYPRISLTDLPILSRGPVIGMNDRGLEWLAVKPDTNPGSVQIFAAAAEVSVKTEGPTVATVRHAEVAAKPATLKVDFRRPIGNFDPNVTVNADVATIDVVGGKYQTIIRAEVAQVNVTSPDAKVKGEGEDFVVYLRGNNITVYLGEDN